MNYFLF